MPKVNPRSTKTKTLLLMRPSLPSTGSRKRLPALKLFFAHASHSWHRRPRKRR